MTSRFKTIRPIPVFLYFDFPLALSNVERAFIWIVKLMSGSKPYACVDVSCAKLAFTGLVFYSQRRLRQGTELP